MFSRQMTGRGEGGYVFHIRNLAILKRYFFVLVDNFRRQFLENFRLFYRSHAGLHLDGIREIPAEQKY